RIRREPAGPGGRTTQSRATPSPRSVPRDAGRRADACRARDHRPPRRAPPAVHRIGRRAPRRADRDSGSAGVTVASRTALGLLRAYQRLGSPLLPTARRFAPTCSEDPRLAIVEHGLVPGAGLAALRLA